MDEESTGEETVERKLFNSDVSSRNETICNYVENGQLYSLEKKDVSGKNRAKN